MKSNTSIYFPLFALWLSMGVVVMADETVAKAFDSNKAATETIPFDLVGKTRVKDGKHEFWIPHPEGKISILILPEAPAKLCVKTSPEGAKAMKERENLEVGRYSIKGKCVADKSGKFHIVTAVEKMMPMGPGVVRVEERLVTGKLKVLGDPTKGQGGGEMIVDAGDGISYRIPPKKFDDKPDGLDYVNAAKLDGQQIILKASVQIHPEPPHRVAKVLLFRRASPDQTKGTP